MIPLYHSIRYPYPHYTKYDQTLAVSIFLDFLLEPLDSSWLISEKKKKIQFNLSKKQTALHLYQDPEEQVLVYLITVQFLKLQGQNQSTKFLYQVQVPTTYSKICYLKQYTETRLVSQRYYKNSIQFTFIQIHFI